MFCSFFLFVIIILYDLICWQLIYISAHHGCLLCMLDTTALAMSAVQGAALLALTWCVHWQTRIRPTTQILVMICDKSDLEILICVNYLTLCQLSINACCALISKLNLVFILYLYKTSFTTRGVVLSYYSTEWSGSRNHNLKSFALDPLLPL